MRNVGNDLSVCQFLNKANGTHKDRLKPVREFYSPLYGLYLAYHSLFWHHLGMSGKTYAEALSIILKGPDKWLTAIWHAALFGI